MGILNNIRGRFVGNTDPEYKKKYFLLKHLTSKEINILEKEYFGNSVKFYWTDENGIERSRTPSRDELCEHMSNKIPTEIILDKFPKLKKHLE